MKMHYTLDFLEQRYNEQANIWRESGEPSYLNPIAGSFYVPRLVRNILKEGGTVLA
ncbi:hypothetical protein HMSSN036_00240 [Paenibacillus macerans]|uniref:hypothetical protein n=1 Tax=Paenibacillus TaxID=44249 RepID=UPI000EC4F212|nr:hypothetical protein [Paenibacillus macerans]MBS5912025.1 hypothetical protein [Paenibacillus macerans]MDU7475660.1 hypothetical protein [Paenibacillus macerans]MEC0140137.1 hypothetical protein [Paenibacillus macerans]MEC0330727.1 hypothetical protein [Paenibacillus macerans]GBK61645.1 hypothetical protein PbDSM24746_16490 [Paenibacillus macerans]